MNYCRAIAFLVIFTSCSLYAATFSGSMNKCVTTDGRIEFTDQPCFSAAHSSHTGNMMYTKGRPSTKDKAASTSANAPAMVRIPGRNYEIGKYEVTQGEWKAVMGNNPSRFNNCGDSCPVEQVSWNDIQIFIQKLNQQTGKQYRLPTEAEWEYACYGGSRNAYCGGNNLDRVGWSSTNSNNQTHPAGQKQVNGYGLYDMSGNVLELTSDCWEENCLKRVLRGGSFEQDEHADERSGWAKLVGRVSNMGFRLAKTLPDGKVSYTDSSPAASPDTQHRQQAIREPVMVRIPSRNYEIGKYEVTQGEWKALMSNNPSRFSKCGDSCPVEQASWNDVQIFIQKLNQKTGKQYRLPTEAEWEYACYGGTQSEYCGGSNLDSVGWSYKNSNNQTHPAGQKQANSHGLYDMNGNVWEMTSDCWEGNCSKRVLRGSSWDNISRDKRGAIRYWIAPEAENDDSGFRLARTLP